MKAHIPLVQSSSKAFALMHILIQLFLSICFFFPVVEQFAYTVTLEANDTVYFAYSYPYTLSDLHSYLRSIAADPSHSSHCRQRSLCKTINGNDCPVLTITDFTSNAAEIKQRKAVVLTSRVHSGETCASWIMKGIIDHLLSTTASARALRANFFFKIVPCLNPDGVVVGNYRTNLAGYDLNRCWEEPSKELHPTIYRTKQVRQQRL